MTRIHSLVHQGFWFLRISDVSPSFWIPRGHLHKCAFNGILCICPLRKVGKFLFHTWTLKELSVTSILPRVRWSTFSKGNSSLSPSFLSLFHFHSGLLLYSITHGRFFSVVLYYTLKFVFMFLACICVHVCFMCVCVHVKAGRSLCYYLSYFYLMYIDVSPACVSLVLEESRSGHQLSWNRNHRQL